MITLEEYEGKQITWDCLIKYLLAFPPRVDLASSDQQTFVVRMPSDGLFRLGACER